MTSSKTTWLTLLALKEPRLAEVQKIQVALAEQGRGELPPELTSQTEGMLTFAWGEATAACTLVPRPIPASQLAGPCETAWYWPQAAEVLHQHTAHLLTTLVDEGRDAIEKALRLTRFTVAIARSSATLGVVWGPGGLVHEPGAFAQQARQMDRDNLPLYLWISFRIEPLAGGGHQLFTTGLEAFDRKELEFDRFTADPQQVLNDAYNVTHYLLNKNSTIRDEDTIGLPDGRQLTAFHGTSILGDDQQVIRLQYEP